MISKIISRKILSENFIKLEIKPSERIDTIKPGQYVIIRIVPEGAAITLPIVKTDSVRETLTVILSSVPEKLAGLLNPCVSRILIELEGPFGEAFRIENFGNVLCVVNRESMIPLYPILVALKAAGNQITCLINGSANDDQILENELRGNSDNLLSCADNTSRRSSQVLEQTLRSRKYNQLFTIGPAKTIRETFMVCTATSTPVQAMLYMTKQTQVGHHGVFRVSICGHNRAICVDGYNFNAYYMSFEELMKRFENERCETPLSVDISRKVNVPV